MRRPRGGTPVLTLALALALAFAVTALSSTAGQAAQTRVYRCGTNQYSDVPCLQAQVLDVDDSRSEAERATARDVAARVAALAGRMTADRERAEAALAARSTARPQPLSKSKVGGTTAVAASAHARRGRLRPREDDEGNFIAYIPAPRRITATK